MISGVREYLDSEGFIEVETPVLQPLYGGALARPFTTHFNALDRDFYLRIATELYLKRLIVGGLERVYELGKDFRNEGLSPKHNPEFTMLEFYEAYADYLEVADRFERLTAHVGLQGSWRRESLHEAILSRTGVDIDKEDLEGQMRGKGLEVPEGEDWAGLVDELVSKHVEPTLIEPTMLLDYPVALSPFAKRHRDREGYVERFEAYAGGIEIANAFTELNDPDEQRARFEAAGQPADEVVPAGAGVRDAADRRAGPGNRPPGDGAERETLDQRGRAVPGDAGLGGVPGGRMRPPAGRHMCRPVRAVHAPPGRRPHAAGGPHQ